MREQRRILMTADALGGVWQYACSIAPNLAALDYEVLLAVMGPKPDDEQRRAVAMLEGVQLIETGLPLDWVGSSQSEMHMAAREIAAIAAVERCDLVHLNSPLLAAGAQFPAPVLTAAHGCISTWWQAARAEPLDPAFHWHRAMSAEGFRRSGAIVAPTRTHAQAVRDCYGLSRPVHAVFNGRRPPERNADAALHDFCFTAGRLWDDVKNTALLDEVAEHLPFPFHAAGRSQGPNGETVALRHLNPLGQISDFEMARWLGARPVFVSAAMFEPFGLAVLEAAQAGCPLVLSDIPSFRELWEGAAVFVPAEDVAAYVCAITECVVDPLLRRHWGDRARKRAQSYTPEATASALSALYSALLSEKAAA